MTELQQTLEVWRPWHARPAMAMSMSGADALRCAQVSSAHWRAMLAIQVRFFSGNVPAP